MRSPVIMGGRGKRGKKEKKEMREKGERHNNRGVDYLGLPELSIEFGSFFQ